MSNRWLFDKLKATDATVVWGEPVMEVRFANRTEMVFCPSSDEYSVNGDVVKRAADNGATIISYPGWCMTSYEAKKYAKELGLTVMGHSEFFAYLKRKGVYFAGG